MNQNYKILIEDDYIILVNKITDYEVDVYPIHYEGYVYDLTTDNNGTLKETGRNKTKLTKLEQTGDYIRRQSSQAISWSIHTYIFGHIYLDEVDRYI
jgi:hypothetical protein